MIGRRVLEAFHPEFLLDDEVPTVPAGQYIRIGRGQCGTPPQMASPQLKAPALPGKGGDDGGRESKREEDQLNLPSGGEDTLNPSN